MNRTHLFIAISSSALIVVLAIQINWLFQTAKMKEAFFNEKAHMVISRTAEALSADRRICQKMEASLEMDSNAEMTAKLGTAETHKIDSLLLHYMKFYNFHIDYTYKIIKPNFISSKNIFRSASPALGDELGCYQKGLEAMANENGLELKVVFPEKKQFIMAEMSSMFIASVILIVVVLMLFWRTVLLLLKEKKISEHTTEFLNNMTHEFKTPLTNIALAGKMMVKDSTINQENKIKHYSGIILQENEKLRLQVEQVLSMTALERGEIPLQKQALDFHLLIHDCIKQMGIQIENQQGNVTLKLLARNAVIMGDAVHLNNALCNLIDNAIKYANEIPELSIQTLNNNQNLVIICSDKGIGIEKEYHKKVFNKYFRVPTGDVHNVKGFGLGLAYVSRIVTLHHGTIELESDKGKGTIFTITLPNV